MVLRIIEKENRKGAKDAKMGIDLPYHPHTTNFLRLLHSCKLDVGHLMVRIARC